MVKKKIVMQLVNIEMYQEIDKKIYNTQIILLINNCIFLTSK